MNYYNTTDTYGAVARIFHWLTALLILTAVPLGLIANSLPFDTAEAVADKARLFSLHKTIGVAAFFVALARILWALTQTRPRPLHPERRAETIAAEVAHWLLYISMIVVPLSGWVHHAATTGFAPILWPFGQDLPLVAKSEALASVASAMHWVFTKVMAATIIAHIAGALKHHWIDRDKTLIRMLKGARTTPPGTAHRKSPLFAALVIYALGGGLAFALVAPDTPSAPPATTLSAVASDWQVTEGTLGLTVRQMGSDVTGSFAGWTAAIRFDPEATGPIKGDVRVTVDLTSLTLGSVTAQVQGAEFLDTATHPTAIFTADILSTADGLVAEGMLDLHGVSLPVALPFALTIEDGQARMTGEVTLDRRDFGIGDAYPDEGTVGFATVVSVALSATRDQ